MRRSALVRWYAGTLVAVMVGGALHAAEKTVEIPKRQVVSPTKTGTAATQPPKPETLAAPEGATLKSPTRAIKDLDVMLNSYRVGKNLTAEDQEYNRQLKQKILHNIFNLRELARLALDKHWSAITEADQNEFVALLTSLLEERSIFAKEKAHGELYQIRYLGDKYLDADQSHAFTRTVIRIPKEDLNIRIDYKLKKVNGGWQVYDIIADQASLVDNYRYTFNEIIVKNGYPDLVRRMKTKLEQIRSKRDVQTSLL